MSVKITTPLYRTPQLDDDRHFYSTSRWQQIRRRHRELEPLCRECARQGIVRVGSCVDHIRRIRAGGSRIDEANLQTLCRFHHDEKTAREAFLD